ncbi:golgin subfamily A member 6-like protein 25 [Macrobrachium rosenbergii]|uniref:golgin subfamily A member 6-like protein 25 n=1 Tax=Macrobrachium rosenbergii TaxID=79674 RepID=UPI0034D427B6
MSYNSGSEGKIERFSSASPRERHLALTDRSLTLSQKLIEENLPNEHPMNTQNKIERNNKSFKEVSHGRVERSGMLLSFSEKLRHLEEEKLLLVFVGCDLYASIIKDGCGFFCCQGVNSGLQVLDTFAAAVDSLEPEIVQQPNSLLAPTFAVAKPGLALLAGLALAVSWKYKFYGLKSHELEECMESECRDSEDDRENVMSDSEDLGTDVNDSEDDLSDSEMDMSDSDVDFETDMNDSEDDFEPDVTDGEDYSETEMSFVSRLEDSLELEDGEMQNDLETDQETQLPRPISQVYVSKMEHLWKEAVEKTVWLQNQLLDKDVLLEKNAQEEAEMKREIETVYLQNEQLQTEKRRLEDDLDLAQDRRERTEKLNKELREETASLQQALVDKERELESAKERETKLVLKLKESETFNQVLASEKEHFERLVEDYTDALAKEERKVENLQELLARKAIESEKDREKLSTLEGQMTAIEGTVAELESQTMEVKDNQAALQGKLELTESENSRLREVAAGLQDGNCELEKNLANKTHKNLILEDRLQSLETVLCQKEDRLVSATKIFNAERAKTEILRAELQVMKNWVSQLGGQNANINEKLEEKEAEITSVKKELQNEKMKTQILEAEVQVMKNWVAELGGQNARHLEEADENHLKTILLKKYLRKEKQTNRILQDALHHGKEMEKLLEEEKKRGNEMETSLRTLKVELDNKDLQIENFLDTERKLIWKKEELEEKLSAALNHGKEQDSLLEEADQKVRKIANDFEEEVQKRDNQIQDLLAQEEKLKGEKLVLEDELENAVNLLAKERMEQEREQRCLRERQRRLEEALKEQDKYMLMTLLHGTAQRNFHLQQIALQHENEILDITEKERQEEDLWMRKEKQHRKYCDTQRERTNYSNQWEVLTCTLTDIVHGDERTPEATTGDSNKNCEILNENLADKTFHESGEDEMC